MAEIVVKFCGITRQEDAEAADGLGADFCGFIFHPASPRAVSPAAAAAIHSGRLRRVGVFVEQKAPEILEIMRVARLDFAQLHGGQSVECARALGGRAIKVFWPARHLSPAQLAEEAGKFAPHCAWFLLDSGTAGGGHGVAVNFAALGGLQLPRPWILAGGLCAANIKNALALARPAGLDINSGVEDAPGRKNRLKMAQALLAARS